MSTRLAELFEAGQLGDDYSGDPRLTTFSPPASVTVVAGGAGAGAVTGSRLLDLPITGAVMSNDPRIIKAPLVQGVPSSVPLKSTRPTAVAALVGQSVYISKKMPVLVSMPTLVPVTIPSRSLQRLPSTGIPKYGTFDSGFTKAVEAGIPEQIVKRPPPEYLIQYSQRPMQYAPVSQERARQRAKELEAEYQAEQAAKRSWWAASMSSLIPGGIASGFQYGQAQQQARNQRMRAAISARLKADIEAFNNPLQREIDKSVAMYGSTYAPDAALPLPSSYTEGGVASGIQAGKTAPWQWPKTYYWFYKGPFGDKRDEQTGPRGEPGSPGTPGPSGQDYVVAEELRPSWRSKLTAEQETEVNRITGNAYKFFSSAASKQALNSFYHQFKSKYMYVPGVPYPTQDQAISDAYKVKRDQLYKLLLKPRTNAPKILSKEDAEIKWLDDQMKSLARVVEAMKVKPGEAEKELEPERVEPAYNTADLFGPTWLEVQDERFRAYGFLKTPGGWSVSYKGEPGHLYGKFIDQLESVPLEKRAEEFKKLANMYAGRKVSLPQNPPSVWAFLNSTGSYTPKRLLEEAFETVNKVEFYRNNKNLDRYMQTLAFVFFLYGPSPEFDDTYNKTIDRIERSKTATELEKQTDLNTVAKMSTDLSLIGRIQKQIEEKKLKDAGVRGEPGTPGVIGPTGGTAIELDPADDPQNVNSYVTKRLDAALRIRINTLEALRTALSRLQNMYGPTGLYGKTLSAADSQEIISWIRAQYGNYVNKIGP